MTTVTAQRLDGRTFYRLHGVNEHVERSFALDALTWALDRDAAEAALAAADAAQAADDGKSGPIA